MEKKRKKIWVTEELYARLEKLAEEADMPFQDFVDIYLRRYAESCLRIYGMGKPETPQNVEAEKKAN